MKIPYSLTDMATKNYLHVPNGKQVLFLSELLKPCLYTRAGNFRQP